VTPADEREWLAECCEQQCTRLRVNGVVGCGHLPLL